MHSFWNKQNKRKTRLLCLAGWQSLTNTGIIMCFLWSILTNTRIPKFYIRARVCCFSESVLLYCCYNAQCSIAFLSLSLCFALTRTLHSHYLRGIAHGIVRYFTMTSAFVFCCFCSISLPHSYTVRLILNVFVFAHQFTYVFIFCVSFI